MYIRYIIMTYVKEGKMSYKLLAEKLLRDKEKIITRDKIRGYTKTLKLSYGSAIGYLLNNEYVIRILRGVFYVKSLEERKNHTIDIPFYEAITKALEIKNVKNWYFGLESAIKLNNLTHEYFAMDYIISDKLKRPRSIEILDHKVKFIAIKKGLTTFGKAKGNVPYSDVEKTILDKMYLGIYRGVPESSIKNSIIDYIYKCNRKRLMEYAKHYPKTVLGLIIRIKNDKQRDY